MLNARRRSLFPTTLLTFQLEIGDVRLSISELCANITNNLVLEVPL